jgi:hypothetical protein
MVRGYFSDGPCDRGNPCLRRAGGLRIPRVAWTTSIGADCRPMVAKRLTGHDWSQARHLWLDRRDDCGPRGVDCRGRPRAVRFDRGMSSCSSRASQAFENSATRPGRRAGATPERMREGDGSRTSTLWHHDVVRWSMRPWGAVPATGGSIDTDYHGRMDHWTETDYEPLVADRLTEQHGGAPDHDDQTLPQQPRQMRPGPRYRPAGRYGVELGHDDQGAADHLGGTRRGAGRRQCASPP